MPGKYGLMGDKLDELVLTCETPAEVAFQWNSYFRDNYPESLIRVVDVYVTDDRALVGAIMNDSIAGPYTWCGEVLLGADGKLSWRYVDNIDIEPDTIQFNIE